MRAGMLAFCLGVWLCSRLPVLPAVDAGVALALVFSLLALPRFLRKLVPGRAGRSLSQTLILATSLLLGLTWATHSAQRHQAQILPHALEGVDFWLSGQIASLPAPRDRFQQFELRIASACLRLHPDDCVSANDVPALNGARVTLNEYSDLALWPGDTWRFRVRLNRPHGLSNPGGYDYEAALFQRGIIARGYVRDTAFNQRLQRAGPGMQSGRAALRVRLQDTELPHAGVLGALTLGDRDGVSSAQWQLLSATGTNHLLVISGLHVGFVALTVYAWVNLLARLWPWLLLRVPAQRLAAGAAVLAALTYSMLAGFSLPTQRALIMIVVLMGGRLLGRQFLPSYSLLLAATLVLLLDPMSVVQAGFWLSFCAVAALLFVFTGYQRRREPGARHDAPGNAGVVRVMGPAAAGVWRRWLQPQWAVSLGLLLPLILWTGQVSLISPLVNVIAIPLVSLLIVPLALAGAALVMVQPGLGYGPLWLADRLLELLFQGLECSAALGPAPWQAAPPGPLAAGAALLGVVLILAPRGLLPLPAAWLLPSCLLLPLIFPRTAARPLEGHAQLQFLDVGQGLAVVVQTRNHTLLFDTGPRMGPQFDAGQGVIIPYLRNRGVDRLDTLMVSHWHQDHSGGLASILEEMPVSRRMAGSLSFPGAENHGFERCQAGQQWRWDGVEFRVLHPANDVYSNENDNSCVLLIEALGQRALLTGDAEQVAELALLTRDADSLRADVLQAGHHGSATSSTVPFLAAVAPRLTVVSAGYRNRFAHPSAQVLARLRAEGSQICQTQYSGAVQIELGAAEGPVLSSAHRLRFRRFWHNIPPGDYGKVAAGSAGGDTCGRNRDGGRLADAADNSVFHSGDCDCH